jgi:hypothetical protein
MAKKEITSAKVASVASKVLRSENASKTTKSAAGSALSQAHSSYKVTSKEAATAASKVLRSSNASKAAKSAAGSALAQRTDRKK